MLYLNQITNCTNDRLRILLLRLLYYKDKTGEFMFYSKDQMAEIDILVRFNLQTTQQGIKVHSNATTDHVAAVQRLFDKGLVTQIDGGYLTDLGRKAAEHAQGLILMLAPQEETTVS